MIGQMERWDVERIGEGKYLSEGICREDQSHHDEYRVERICVRWMSWKENVQWYAEIMICKGSSAFPILMCCGKSVGCQQMMTFPSLFSFNLLCSLFILTLTTAYFILSWHTLLFSLIALHTLILIFCTFYCGCTNENNSLLYF